MKVLSNKSGLGLPAVLAIIVFVISSTVIVFTNVYSTSIAIEADFKANQEYINSQNLIDVAAKIIIRDEDLSQAYLDDLSDYLGISISEYDDGIYSITDEISNGTIVSSYLAEASSAFFNINMGDTVFDATGIENSYDHDALLEPAVILSSFLTDFMTETFPSLGYNETFGSFTDIFDYFENLADDGSTYTEVSASVLRNMSNPVVGGHWFVTGNLTIKDNSDLIIPDGYVLFIDGNLEMGTRSLLSGIVVVKGKVKFDTNTKWGELEGTVYCGGNFIAERTLYLGTYSRPAFVFADGKIDLRKYVYGYGFFYSAERFEVNRNYTDIDFTGGAYSPDTVYLSSSEVESYYGLDNDDLYDLGVSNIISIIDESSSNDGFVYTAPK